MSLLIRALALSAAVIGVITAGTLATVLALPGFASRPYLSTAHAHTEVGTEPSAAGPGKPDWGTLLPYRETSGQSEIMEAADLLPARYEQTIVARRGDTLSALLAMAMLDDEEATAAVDAVSELFNLRDLQPGQTIHLTLQSPPPGAALRATVRPHLVALRFAPDADREIRLARHDGTFAAEARERVLARAEAYEFGSIISSLFTAGRSVGVPTSVLAEMVRALSFDVDFQRDIQPDDRFEVLYESFLDEDGNPVKAGDLLFAALTVQGRQIELYRFAPEGGEADFYTPKGQSARKALLRTPVDGARISSAFGMRKHPILGYSKLHRGVDFAAPAGTPIYAAGDGVILRAGRFGSYGKYVRIKHTSTYATAYAHLSRIAKSIKAGAKVKQGQVIGAVGATGRATGPHLHYEVLVDGKQVDPRKVKVAEGDRLRGADLAAFRAFRNKVDRLRTRHSPALVARANASDGPLLQ
jgi:murein DD-endopeptidase MepM/ murein hydrolase activator NlpD